MDSGSQEPQDPVKDWFAMGFFGGLLLTASCFVLIGLVGQVSGGKFLGTGLMSSAMLYTYFAIGVVQLLWLTPFAAVLAWLAGGRVLARWRTSPWPDRLCAALGLPILLFFAAVLFVRPVRGHWAAPAYVTLVALAAAGAWRPSA